VQALDWCLDTAGLKTQIDLQDGLTTKPDSGFLHMHSNTMLAGSNVLAVCCSCEKAIDFLDSSSAANCCGHVIDVVLRTSQLCATSCLIEAHGELVLSGIGLLAARRFLSRRIQTLKITRKLGREPARYDVMQRSRQLRNDSMRK
jgi:hypothetical protein